MLERGDERELDGLALLVAGVDRQLVIRVGLNPDRLDERRSGVVVRIGGRAVVDRQNSRRAPLDQAQAGVGGDPVQPRAQRAAAFEPRQPAPGAQQRFLERILRVGHRAEHPIAVSVELAPVGRDEALERRLVARLRGPECVRVIHGFGRHIPISPPTGVVTTLRQPVGPSRGSSSTLAPSLFALSVEAATSSTST